MMICWNFRFSANEYGLQNAQATVTFSKFYRTKESEERSNNCGSYPRPLGGKEGMLPSKLGAVAINLSYYTSSLRGFRIQRVPDSAI